MSEPRNPFFIARLFNFSFSRFVALTLIKIVYVLLMIVGLAGIGFGLFKLYQLGHYRVAIYASVGSPLIYLIYLVVIRLICETLIVIFAIAEDLEEIRQGIQKLNTQQGTGQGEEA